MPTTIGQAFAAAGLTPEGIVKWGTKPNQYSPGVYIVCLTNSLDAFDGKLIEAPLAVSQFEQWLRVCPELTLDGVQPTVRQLMHRVMGFWIPDEVILYIGLAESLSERLGHYYR